MPSPRNYCNHTDSFTLVLNACTTDSVLAMQPGMLQYSQTTLHNIPPAIHLATNPVLELLVYCQGQAMLRAFLNRTGVFLAFHIHRTPDPKAQDLLACLCYEDFVIEPPDPPSPIVYAHQVASASFKDSCQDLAK